MMTGAITEKVAGAARNFKYHQVQTISLSFITCLTVIKTSFFCHVIFDFDIINYPQLRSKIQNRIG